MVEQPAVNRKAVGSSPAMPAIKCIYLNSLTGRASGFYPVRYEFESCLGY